MTTTPTIPAIYPAFTASVGTLGAVGPTIDVRLRSLLDVQVSGTTTGQIGLLTSIDGVNWMQAAESVTGAGRFSVEVAAACWARLSVLTIEAVTATATVGAR